MTDSPTTLLVGFDSAWTAHPLGAPTPARVFETWPVLAMIAWGWTLPDKRAAGRLPKYNPTRRKTFSISDWQHVCRLTSGALRKHGLAEIARWVDDAAATDKPRKADQDRLDACVCLLVPGEWVRAFRLVA
jgi:predicted RNase H-like nuclease